MVYFRILITTMLGGLLLIGGCSSSDSSDSPSQSDSEKVAAARNAALSSISSNLDTSLNSVNTVMNESTAMDVLVDTGAGTSVNATPLVGQNVTAKANTLVGALTTSMRNNISPMTSHTATDAIEQQLADLMGEGTVNGNTIIYHPDLDKVCANENNDPEFNEQVCREFFGRISIVQTIISDTDGTLTFKFDNHAPFVIGYSSNSVYFEVVLAELKGAVTAVADYLATQNVPVTLDATYTTFEGTIRLTITKLGEQAASVALSIPQALSISGTIDGHAESLSIAATDKVVEISADAVANEASLSFGLGAVSAMSAVEDINNPGVLLPTSLNLSALEGVFTISSPNGVDTLVASNVNLGNSGMTYSIDNVEAFNIDMDTLGFTVNGAEQTVTFDTNLNASFAIENVNLAFADLFALDATLEAADPTLQGSLAVTAPNNTVMENLGAPPLDPTANEIFQLNQGSFSASGTGLFEGNVTVNTGECFTEPETGMFPIEVTTCPMVLQ